MNLTEAFTLRVAIPEPVDYGDTPWGPRIFVASRPGRGRPPEGRHRPEPWW